MDDKTKLTWQDRAAIKRGFDAYFRMGGTGPSKRTGWGYELGWDIAREGRHTLGANPPPGTLEHALEERGYEV